MQLIRFGQPDHEKPGVLFRHKRKDLSDYFTDWNVDFFKNGGLQRLSEILEESADGLPNVSEDQRWAAPVPMPGKIICIGCNYRDHARESGADVPEEPPAFMKAANAFCGPYDDLVIPYNSTHTDWEVELGVIIGERARLLSTEEEAAQVIGGYALANDVSERDYQKNHCGQWCKGKSCETFAPVGPFFVTSDELPDPNNLPMSLHKNGELKQDGNTSDMVFDPFALVQYLSGFMTLDPGDIIFTGTPAGVGAGRNPPEFLREGDEVQCTIGNVGNQRRTCVAEV